MRREPAGAAAVRSIMGIPLGGASVFPLLRYPQWEFLSIAHDGPTGARRSA